MMLSVDCKFFYFDFIEVKPLSVDYAVSLKMMLVAMVRDSIGDVAVVRVS